MGSKRCCGSLHVCRKVAANLWEPASVKQYPCDLGTPKPASLSVEGAYSGHITLFPPWVPVEDGLQGLTAIPCTFPHADQDFIFL